MKKLCFVNCTFPLPLVTEPYLKVVNINPLKAEPRAECGQHEPSLSDWYNFRLHFDFGFADGPLMGG